MYYLKLMFGFLITIAVANSQRPGCGVMRGIPLLFNGTDAWLGEFPWQVAIFSKSRSYLLICGGTLITPYAVLTAAHCFYNEYTQTLSPNPMDYIIAVGKLKRNFTENEGEIYRKDHEISTIQFPDKPYDPDINNAYDIALIILKESIVISPHVRPACYRAYKNDSKPESTGQTGLLPGWGQESQDGNPSSTLKKIELKIIDYNHCAEVAKSILAQDKFCAGVYKGSQPGRGDSGGGLVFFNRRTQTYFLRGIVSLKQSHEVENSTVTSFTDILYHLNWIEEIIEQYSKNLSINTSPNATHPGNVIIIEKSISYSMDAKKRILLMDFD